jgi:hypothetical protein
MQTSPLRLGVIIILTTLGVAAVAGLIAVLDADHVGSAAGIGFGIAVLVFTVGGTIACALACLVRRKVEIAALAGLLVAGIALDLLVVAIWKNVDDEAYGKVAGITFAWTLFSLLVLGLTLATGEPTSDDSSRGVRVLYGLAVAAAVVSGTITTWLVATAGDAGLSDLGPSAVSGVQLDDDKLLRALGATLVLAATLWFAALAASRIDRPEPTA